MILTNDGAAAWPKKNVIFSNYPYLSVHDFEKWISNAYRNQLPTVFDYGRDAISAVGKLLEEQNQKLIDVPPFTTQCVVHALNSSGLAVATPIYNKGDCDFVYHQYGLPFTQKCDPIIDDSIDTMFRIGRDPFRTNSQFTIWSFRKSLGIPLGAVVWSRDKESQSFLMQLSKEYRKNENDICKNLSYVKGTWESEYSKRETNLELIIEIFKNEGLSKSYEGYERLVKEGIIPIALEVNHLELEALTVNLGSDLLIVRRHRVDSPNATHKLTAFLPVWQNLERKNR